MAEPDLARTARRRRIVGGALVAAFAAVQIAIVVVRSAGEKVLNENGETLVLVGKDTPTDEVGLDAILVIWPHGTTIKTPDPLRVTIDGKTYGLGDRISTGGGSGSIGPSSSFYDKVPRACRAAEVFVANNG